MKSQELLDQTLGDLFRKPENHRGIVAAESLPPPQADLIRIINSWAEIDPAEAVDGAFCQLVIEEYVHFHNLQNGETVGKHIHNTMTDGLYSRHNLPALAVLHRVAQEKNDPDMKRSAGMALFSLHSSMVFINDYAIAHHCSLSEALANMRAGITRGETDLTTFFGLMGYARKFAALAIYANIDNVPHDTVIQIGKSTPDTWYHRAGHALGEYIESETGFELGRQFRERLFDPHVKVLLLSVDVNSTLNVAESYANVQYLEAFLAQLKKLADKFHLQFPEKQMFVVLNTGRPSFYAWCASDLLACIPEMRQFHVAESGGVIVHVEGSGIRKEVAVDNSRLWREQLDGLKAHLLQRMHDHGSDIFEEKMSMLSVQIAQKQEEGGQLLLTTNEGQPVTAEWIQEQKEIYLRETARLLNLRIKTILEQLEAVPEAQKYLERLSSGPDGASGTDDDMPLKVLEVLRAELVNAPEYRTAELNWLRDALETIRIMEKKLVAVFNATAGYVDIFHRDLNKFSTVMRQLKNMGYRKEEILFVHVGDSATDIIPTEQTEEGEVNEGAREAFLIGVQNSSQNLRDTIYLRRLSGHGGVTARREILGVIDVVLGITNMLTDRMKEE